MINRIEVFNPDDLLNPVAAISEVLSANFYEAIDGRCTFDFSVLADVAADFALEMVVNLHMPSVTHVFVIEAIAKSGSSGLNIVEITCEHITNELNNPAYDLEIFDISGTPKQILTALLGGTPFSAGEVEFTTATTYKINKKCSLRQAVMNFVALLCGEIEYDGVTINIRVQRGNWTTVAIMDGTTVSSLSVTENAEGKAYEITLYKNAKSLGVGDQISINYTPLSISENTRILGLSYNPFYMAEISVEVGEYKMSFDESFYKTEDTLSKKIEPLKPVGKLVVQETGAIDLQTVNPDTEAKEDNEIDSTDNNIERCQEMIGDTTVPLLRGIYEKAKAVYLDTQSIPVPQGTFPKLPANMQNIIDAINFGLASKGGGVKTLLDLIKLHPVWQYVHQAVDDFNANFTYGVDWDTYNYMPFIDISKASAVGLLSNTTSGNFNAQLSSADTITIAPDGSSGVYTWNKASMYIKSTGEKVTQPYTVTLTKGSSIPSGAAAYQKNSTVASISDTIATSDAVLVSIERNYLNTIERDLDTDTVHRQMGCLHKVFGAMTPSGYDNEIFITSTTYFSGNVHTDSNVLACPIVTVDGVTKLDYPDHGYYFDRGLVGGRLQASFLKLCFDQIN
jgi:hypothetical protein